ncbi:hypothetical protein BGW38_010689 [Lunasporangiospora selenospora]|uniref:Uncharacterized protein n=1 Tax=Lunasporangiospora selenospora TaxID=979761 RepID=A0A9P6FWS7_9FUNG|nr:hypothetical protein BGW38_010689 [Lunasporangiospora selenospora]
MYQNKIPRDTHLLSGGEEDPVGYSGAGGAVHAVRAEGVVRAEVAADVVGVVDAEDVVDAADVAVNGKDAEDVADAEDVVKAVKAVDDVNANGTRNAHLGPQDPQDEIYSHHGTPAPSRMPAAI